MYVLAAGRAEEASRFLVRLLIGHLGQSLVPIFFVLDLMKLSQFRRLLREYIPQPTELLLLTKSRLKYKCHQKFESRSLAVPWDRKQVRFHSACLSYIADNLWIVVSSSWPWSCTR